MTSAAALRALLVALACPACTSFTTHLTAAPIGAGETEVGASVSAITAERGVGRSVLPQVELSLRHGLTDDLDLGIELSALGAEVNARRRLLETNGLVLSIVPSAGFELAPLTSADSDLWMIRLGSTLLLDVAITSGVKAVFGAKPLVLIGPRTPVWDDGAAGARVILAPGAMIGLRLPLAGGWAIFPEVDLHVPWDIAEGRARAPIIQGGLGLDLQLGG